MLFLFCGFMINDAMIIHIQVFVCDVYAQFSWAYN